MSAITRAPLDEMTRSHASEHHCPTIAWGVVRGGELSLTGSIGDVDERTVYRIASMTKSFSAAVTLLLRDEGVLQLDDPIERHAPELTAVRAPVDDAPPITVRDLMTMTSGLVADDAWADRHLDLTDDELDTILGGGPTFAETTGTTFEYSNLGYAVLGRVVHRATGKRIQSLITERLLQPIGMADTTWVQPDHDRWMRPMRWDDGEHIEELDTPGDGVIAPMGGLWTNVADLSRWVAWLADAFPARDGRDDGPLRRSSRRELQTGQRFAGTATTTTATTTAATTTAATTTAATTTATTTTATTTTTPPTTAIAVPTTYGYGLRILHRTDADPMIGHAGGLPGYGSSMRWLRDQHIGVIALSNLTYAPMTELCVSLLDELERQSVVARPQRALRPEVAHAGGRLAALLSDWSDLAAGELFADNVAPDDHWIRRRRSAARLADLDDITIEAINDARGRIRATDGSGGTVQITFSLAPHDATRIQAYEIS